MIYENPTIGYLDMTENDWGRFYTLDDNDGVILPPRAYYYRDMKTGNWTDIGIGMIYCAQKTDDDPGNDNTAIVNEELLNTSSPNLFHFGLSSMQRTQIPDLYGGQTFLGLRGIEGTTSQLIAASEQLTYLQGSKIDTGALVKDGPITSIPVRSAHVADDAFSMLALRFTHDRFNNRLHINWGYTASSDPTDTDDVTTLKEYIQSISNVAANAKATFNNVNSVAVYNNFFVYWPFLLNRLKLHCVGAIKIG